MNVRLVACALVLLAAAGLILWSSGHGEVDPGGLVPPSDATGSRTTDPAARMDPPAIGDGARRAVELVVTTVATLVSGSAVDPLARLLRGSERVDVARELAVPDRPRQVPPRGRRLVRFALADGTSCCRLLDLRADETVEVTHDARRVVTGRVVDGTGVPLAGAEVWAGELDAAGAMRTTTTRGDGTFEFDVASGGCVPLCASAPGYAPCVLRSDVGDAGLADVELVLLPAVQREVVMVAVVDEPARGRLHLQPVAGQTAVEHFAWFWRALAKRDAFDERGRLVLDDRPGGIALALTAMHPSAIASGAVTIGPRHDGRLVHVAMEPARTRTLRLLDENGAPIAGAELVAGGEGACPRSDGEGRIDFVVRDGDVPRIAIRSITAADGSLVSGAALVVRLADGTRAWRVRLAGAEWLELPAGEGLVLDGEPRVVDLVARWQDSPEAPAVTRRFEGLVVAQRREVRLPD
ncbi:MAG: carboxypeptidase regulatory-like domain-containing protein [Planctomycetes bacterium]|nr:carboxypeptidase regulatory-like domain-containing protein [Planctomycetota bacterium]